MERAFLAIVFTTFGGIGPADACAWLDSLFHTAYTAEYLGGGTGQRTAHQRLVFYQSLQASLTRSCSDMIRHLTPTPHTTTAARPAPAPTATTAATPPRTGLPPGPAALPQPPHD